MQSSETGNYGIRRRFFCFCLIGFFRCFDSAVHILHLTVDFRYLFGAVEHFLVDSLRQLGLIHLIPDVVLKACPEIHGNRAKLDLRYHILRSVRKIYRDTGVEMQGTVAVVVRLLDIVLLFENLHILLPFKISATRYTSSI